MAFSGWIFATSVSVLVMVATRLVVVVFRVAMCFKMMSILVVYEAESIRNLAMVSAKAAIDSLRFGGLNVGGTVQRMKAPLIRVRLEIGGLSKIT